VSGIGKSEGCCLPSGPRQISRLVVYPAKIGAILLGCPTSPDLELQITTYSGPYRIPLMERTSILWNPVKTTWSSLAPRKMPSSGRMES